MNEVIRAHLMPCRVVPNPIGFLQMKDPELASAEEWDYVANTATSRLIEKISDACDLV
jgi:hypothetical protein